MRTIRSVTLALIALTTACGGDANAPTRPDFPVGTYSYDIDEHVAMGGWGWTTPQPPFPHGFLSIYEASADSLVLQWNLSPGAYSDTLQTARLVDGKYRVSMAVESGWSGEHRLWHDEDGVRCEAVFSSPVAILTPCVVARVGDP